MSRPSAKLCANCSPALRPRGQTVRSATPLRVRSRSLVTTTTTASPLLYARQNIPNKASATTLTRGVPGYGVARLQCCARGLASISEETGTAAAKTGPGPVDGPLREYDVRVEQGRLRDDPYQRGESSMFGFIEIPRTGLESNSTLTYLVPDYRHNSKPPRSLRSS